jgi:hypothetical protein
LKEKQLTSVLKTLGYLAELSPSTFETVKGRVVTFLETLLEKTVTNYLLYILTCFKHSKKKSKDQTGPSSECEKKVNWEALLIITFK